MVSCWRESETAVTGLPSDGIIGLRLPAVGCMYCQSSGGRFPKLAVAEDINHGEKNLS
jgi:hypothetical protein